MPPSPKPRQILVVDDDEGLLILMAETLRGAGHDVETATSARTARAWLDANKPELMILDLKLPDGGGPALVAELQRDNARVPFVVVTGQGDEKIAVEVMKQGALDYVIKDTRLLDVLPAIVQRALAALAQEKALVAAQAEHKRLEREILAAGERERHSIGADLHDNLGQQLTALELMCATLKEEAAAQPAIARRLGAMGKMLRESITQTRALARGLVPVGSDPDALQNGLTELVERINSLNRVRCRLDCPEPVLVNDPFVAGHLYRIAQEGVNNALKHAKAKHITVRLASGDGSIVLEIADDGTGLPKTRSPQRGLGLGVMQHRASGIGGELSLVSKRNQGMVIRCTVPLNGRSSASR
ncbi:MAG TPA: response regulator [Opitutaceae bacterium]|nr:response regulator [Opitutaceae bacterium]